MKCYKLMIQLFLQARHAMEKTVFSNMVNCGLYKKYEVVKCISVVNTKLMVLCIIRILTDVG